MVTNYESRMPAQRERSAYVHALELRAGLAHLKSICGDDNQDLLSDMIEGELSVDRFISKVVALIAEDEANCLGIKAYAKKIVDRKKRLEHRAGRLRVLLASIVTNLPSRRYRNELASVRAFDIEPSVVIDVEADIPPQFWKQAEPSVDVSAIRKQLNQRRKLLKQLDDCLTKEERLQRRAAIDETTPTYPVVTSTMAIFRSRFRSTDMAEEFRPILIPPQSSAPVRFDLTPKQLDLVWDMNKDLNPREFDQFIETSRALGLSPLSRQVCAVIFNREKADRRQMAIVTTIMGLRAIADRTGTYRPDDRPARIVYRKALKHERANPHGILEGIVTPYRYAQGAWHPVVGQVFWDELHRFALRTGRNG